MQAARLTSSNRRLSTSGAWGAAPSGADQENELRREVQDMPHNRCSAAFADFAKRVYAMRSIIARLTKRTQSDDCPVIGLEVHDRGVLSQEVRLNVIEQQGASPAGGRAGEKGLVGGPPVRFFACGQSGPAETVPQSRTRSREYGTCYTASFLVRLRFEFMELWGNAHVSMCPLTVKCPEPKTALTPLNSGERSRLTRCAPTCHATRS